MFTLLLLFFKKMGQSRPLFIYFRIFLVTISKQFEKSKVGVLGIRMVGADKTTELWRPPLDGDLTTTTLHAYDHGKNCLGACNIIFICFLYVQKNLRVQPGGEGHQGGGNNRRVKVASHGFLGPFCRVRLNAFSTYKTSSRFITYKNLIIALPP